MWGNSYFVRGNKTTVALSEKDTQIIKITQGALYI